MKKCSKCMDCLPLSEFHKDKRSADGVTSHCKKCRKQYKDSIKSKICEYSKKYYFKNKQEIKSKKEEYYLNNKDKILNSHKEYRNKNKEKVAIYHKAYGEKNKKSIMDTKRKYRKTTRGSSVYINSNHNRRAKIKKGTVTSEQINHLKRISKHCYWCGISLENKTSHIDHYTPICKGGQHTIDNLVVSCAKCNLSKHSKDPIEFANSIGKLL